jgi:hypothetical protein
LDIPQTRFILGQLLPYLTYKIDGVQYGLLTPKSLCETIMISTSDNDDKFNFWFKQYKKKYTTKDGKIYEAGLDENSLLTYTKSDPIPMKDTDGNKTGRTQFTYTPNPDPQTGLFGVYPDPKLNNDWCGLILEWLGYGWVMETEEDGGILHPVYAGTESLASDQLKQWFEPNPEIGGRPDNFLSRMGVFPDSPLVTYFCANQYSTKSMIVDPQAFANLLGKSGVNAGGWVGFLNGMSGGSHDLDDYINLIRTTTDNPDPPTPPPCTKGDASKGFVAGTSTAAGIGGIGLMAMGTGNPAGVAIGLAIIAVGAIAGYMSGKDAAKGTCQ